MFLLYCGMLSCDTTPASEAIPADTQEPTIEEPTIEPMHIEGSISMDAASWSSDINRTKENPLKGFLTSYLWGEPTSDFPDSMEYLYVPMKDIWNEHGETFDTGLEPLLEQARGRNHHVVMRIFIDYPSQESALPDYLQDSVSCEPYFEHGGGCSPDYENPLLQDAILSLIQQLGERYNADKRIGFIQAGFLGFWGEWHTWPNSNWFASDVFQQEVMDAFVESFPDTFVQLRYPTSFSAEKNLGYHDDSFSYSTLGDVEWFFYPKLLQVGAENKWKDVPIGGELRPELQPVIFAANYEQDVYAQDFIECVEQIHPTYMLNYWAFNGAGQGYEGDDRIQAEYAAQRMGYQFELLNAELQVTQERVDKVSAIIKLQIAQTGVAPFYYPLYVLLISKDSNFSVSSDIDLRLLLPGDEIDVSFAMEDAPIEVFQQSFLVQFQSDIILEGQQLMMPTITNSTEPSENTSVFWDVQCSIEDTSIQVGASTYSTSENAECFCAFDGQLYLSNGARCVASQ